MDFTITLGELLNIISTIGITLLAGILYIPKKVVSKIATDTAGLISARKLAFENEIGKQIATKQEIESLTKIVKEVEQGYNYNLESLRNELNKISSYKIGFREEERKAVVLFYSVVSEWYANLYDHYLGMYDRFLYMDISKRIALLENYQLKAKHAELNLQMILTDELLQLLSSKFYNKTWNMHLSQMLIYKELQKELAKYRSNSLENIHGNPSNLSDYLFEKSNEFNKGFMDKDQIWKQVQKEFTAKVRPYLNNE